MTDSTDRPLREFRNGPQDGGREDNGRLAVRQPHTRPRRTPYTGARIARLIAPVAGEMQMLALRNAHVRRGPGRLKLLLLPLLALLAAAALAALTLSAGAQTPGGESGSTETALGRIIARVQDRTGADGIDDYRIEFGFFPEWALDEAESWPEAIASRSDWLPSSRFLTKNRIDALAAADNRSWLRSSLIGVPAQSSQSPGADGAEITGSVIARYHPDSEGGLRVEFGFVPEWAFADRASTEEAVALLGVDGLPSARYLRVAAIDARRDVWLRSSVIEVPLRAPAFVSDTARWPEFHGITCSPSSAVVDEPVTCSVTISGGVPDSYAWSGGGAVGSGATYITSFSEAGEHTIRLTVTYDAVGSHTASTTVSVAEPLQPPEIDSVSCTPSSPAVDEHVTCTADLSGGALDFWSWNGGVSDGGEAVYWTSFSEAGERSVSLTVSNAAGSDTESTTLTVELPLQAPVIDGIRCTPPRPATADEYVTCTADLSGGVPDSWVWSGGVSGGRALAYSPSFSAEGDQAISLTVANPAGSDTDSIVLPVGDLQAPIVNAVNCAPSAPVVDREITCTAELGGGAPASWAWGGGASSGGGEHYSSSFSTAGGHAVSLTVTNSAGSATDSITLTVFEELPPPVIDGIDCSPSSPLIDADVTCAASLSGGDPDSYAWSGGGDSSDGESYTASFSPAGDYTVSLTVTNTAGGDTSSITLTVREVHAPVIDSIFCPQHPHPNNKSTRVFCEAILGGGAPDSYTWSGGITDGTEESFLVGNQTQYFVSVDPTGDLTISLTVTNAAGSDSASITVAVDEDGKIGDGPFIGGRRGSDALSIDAIGCFPSLPRVGEDADCVAAVSGDGPIFYAWTGGDGSGDEETYTTSFSAKGDYTVSLTVTNADGSDTDSTPVTVRGWPPVIESIDCSPSSPTIGDDVTCTANLSGGAPASYVWDDGIGSGDSYTVPYLNEPGNHLIRLTVTNADGSDSASTTVTVVAATAVQAPVIDSISCSPSSSTVDESVTCTASLSGGAPASYSWSGGASSGSSATYDTSFSSAGSKTVSLTATNAGGSDTESTIVTVVAAE